VFLPQDLVLAPQPLQLPRQIFLPIGWGRLQIVLTTFVEPATQRAGRTDRQGITDCFRDAEIDGTPHLGVDPDAPRSKVGADLPAAEAAEFSASTRIIRLLEELAYDRAEGIIPERRPASALNLLAVGIKEVGAVGVHLLVA
jgi:hypothetical protein